MMTGDWIDMGAITEIPQRGARTVPVTGGQEIALFRTGDDRIFALVNRCPHKHGPLSQGIVHGASVTCPLHNWVISLETGRAQGADEGCVRTIPVRVEQGTLYIALKAHTERAA